MIVLDFKSGASHPSSELQVSAYCDLARYGIDQEGKKFWDRGNKTAFEISLYHPIYQYCGTIDCVIDDGKDYIEGMILYLKDNGKYSLKPVKNIRQNFEMFLQFLNTAKYCKEKGIER